MSFSSDTKQELCQSVGKSGCCKLAELAAFIHGVGTLRIGRGGHSVVMTTEVPAIARRIFSLCKACFSVTPEVQTQEHKRLGKRNIYHVVIGPDSAQRILEATGLMKETDEGLRFSRAVPLSLLRKTCCRQAYLRGAFLATGTLSDPGKSYHLEITSTSEDYAKSLANFLGKLELPAKVVLRKESYVVYLKESEAIVEVLGRMGAHKALLAFENVRITKNMRNNVNRQANCDNANVEKTMDAAQKQIDAIRYIEENGGFRSLTTPLRLMAEARMEHPDTPLKELGEVMIPPISKSAVNHRLRKLVEIAAQMKEAKEGSAADEERV